MHESTYSTNNTRAYDLDPIDIGHAGRNGELVRARVVAASSGALHLFNLSVRFIEDEALTFHERYRAIFRMMSATRLSFAFQYSSVISMRPPRAMAFKRFASTSEDS